VVRRLGDEFSPRELERLIEDQGLEVRRTTVTGWCPLFYRAARVSLAKAGIKILPCTPRARVLENFWNGLRD